MTVKCVARYEMKHYKLNKKNCMDIMISQSFNMSLSSDKFVCIFYFIFFNTRRDNEWLLKDIYFVCDFIKVPASDSLIFILLFFDKIIDEH